MIALWFLGEYTEAVLGHVKFLVLYLITGFAGSVLILLLSPPLVVTVGASGAIFGIFGALIAYAFLNRQRDSVARAIFGQLMFWLVLNVVFMLTERPSCRGRGTSAASSRASSSWPPTRCSVARAPTGGSRAATWP